MKTISLRARFIVAGALLVATTAASSAWSAYAFRRVSQVVDATLRDSEQTTAATGTLTSALEREDDALLLTLTDDARGRRELMVGRVAVDSAFERVDALLTGPGERAAAGRIRDDVGAYHAAGDSLVAHAADPHARARYHEEANPLLRRAVADATRIRDDHFRSTQEVAAWARDQAARATQVLALVSAVALALSLVVALHLARVVVTPIHSLTDAVDAIRQGEFSRRLPVARRDELGRLAEGFNRMADDLAEFRRANIGEVVRAKETLEATLAALPDAVVVIDADGAVSSANPRASTVIRATRSEPARHLRDLSLPEGTRSAIEASLLEGAAVPRGVDLAKAIAVTIDNESRKLLPRVVPIAGLPGGRRGAVLLLSDVTDLVRLDEMRMELVAVASHELRTPLTTLRMTLLMLQEREAGLDVRDRELVATALQGVEQLAATVTEFLDLTRIEAGQLRLNWDRVDVAALVEHVLVGAEPSCKDANVALKVEFAEDAPRTVWGDAARLGVVLSNVLANAVKYTPGGGVIRVTLAREPAAASPRLRVEVTDTGLGVPVEFRERVFEKFFRVEHHRAGSDAGVRGSGIGLYIAREVLEAHGGSIVCEEGPPGEGARFVIGLPVERGEPLATS